MTGEQLSFFCVLDNVLPAWLILWQVICFTLSIASPSKSPWARGPCCRNWQGIRTANPLASGGASELWGPFDLPHRPARRDGTDN